MAAKNRPAVGRRRGLTVIDVAAMVLGSAVASVHVRPSIVDQGSGWGRLAIVPAFLAIAITASGPFLAMTRRWVEGKAPGPADGIRYWSILGLPWIAAALARAAAPWATGRIPVILVSGLLVASVLVGIDLWRTRLRLDRDQTPPPPVESTHWTGPFGTVIAVGWPVQFACVLMIQTHP